MVWRSFIEVFRGRAWKAAKERQTMLRQRIQTFIESLLELGFGMADGSVEALGLWRGKALLQRDSVLLKIANDGMTLIFDMASSSDPEQWFLLSVVKEELEAAPLTYSREPTPEEVTEFMRERAAEMSILFSAAEWPGFRRRLDERRQALRTFMVEKLRR